MAVVKRQMSLVAQASKAITDCSTQVHTYHIKDVAEAVVYDD
jgi:hypothetical protein